MADERKAEFLDSLELRKVGEREWVTISPLRFYSKELSKTLKVPSGFPTDLASIPRGLWNLFPKEGKQDRAAVLHDCGYNESIIDAVGNPIKLTKKQVDGLFHEGMLADGVGPKSAWLMWKAVSLFGRGRFGRKATV